MLRWLSMRAMPFFSWSAYVKCHSSLAQHKGNGTPRRLSIRGMIFCVNSAEGNSTLCCLQTFVFSAWCRIQRRKTWWMGPYAGVDYNLTSLKKKFRTHVIKLDIAPMSFPPGQYLLVSASNNMLYYLSQWDKIHTTCVVNLMSQDTKFWLFKINCARIRTHNLQDNTLILYQCATFALFKFVQIGYLNS